MKLFKKKEKRIEKFRIYRCHYCGERRLIKETDCLFCGSKLREINDVDAFWDYLTVNLCSDDNQEFETRD